MRHTQRVVIEAAGRDKGKTFLITEMPADQAERWATRAMLLLANAGTKLPDGVLDAGMAGLATMADVFVMSLRTLQGLAYTDELDSILAEMMGCVQFLPAEGIPPQKLFSGENSQIEEVRTRMQLRWEVLQIHTDFSLADALQGLRTPAPVSSAS